MKYSKIFFFAVASGLLMAGCGSKTNENAAGKPQTAPVVTVVTAQAEDVVVAETVELPAVWYDAVCLFPLDDYIFLSGKGGYDDENHRQVVELKCAGRPTLYVDPSGSSYCRYMGVEP